MLASPEESAAKQSEAPPIKTATLAEIYLKQGFLDKARAVYLGLLVQRPDDEGLRQQLAEVERRLATSAAAAGTASPSASEAQGRESEAAVLASFHRWLTAIAQRRRHV